ncbi:MAG: CPBP family intramembrane metalloprotease [Hyphomicrobiaceae bacterium]|nr:CPBP family intramembrane metalloprotease [Hyphomicrobiaceae bacterium]
MTTETPTNQPQHTWVSDIKRIGGAALLTGLVVLVAIIGAAAVTPLLQSSPTTGVGLTNIAQWAVLAAFQIAMIVATILVAAWYGPVTHTLATAAQPDMLSRARIPFLASLLVMLAYSLFSLAFFPDAVAKDMAIFKKLMVGVPLWIPALILVVGAPLSEELLFRGFFLGQLRQSRLGFAGGAVIATLGWTLLHLGYTVVGLLDVFLAGLLFSWTLWRTGTVWVPIAFHALYNATVLAVITLLIPAPA